VCPTLSGKDEDEKREGINEKKRITFSLMVP
jgi:hypothetical protein